jgi:1-deoxy-D-xylulose-5-phosphate synthase
MNAHAGLDRAGIVATVFRTLGRGVAVGVAG